MIIPLIAEQFLTISIGMIDSVMVAPIGETAISAVSLVDSVMILLVNVFTAVATGGGIIAGQMLGMKRADKGSKVVEQTLFFSVASAMLVMGIMYLGRSFIFSYLFGKAEVEVLQHASIYYLIMSSSVPFLALYNVGASTYRMMGNAKLPMMMSLAMNLINLIGNYLLIKVFGMGIAGAAVSSLCSRIFSGVLITKLIMNKQNVLHIRTLWIKPSMDILKKIMAIAIPFGIENSLFQLGKILVLSLVTGLSTAAITANAIANNVGSYAVVMGSSIGVALSIVAAHCVGAQDFKQVRYYTKKLISYAYGVLFVTNVLIIMALPVIMWLYKISNETEVLVRQLLIYHSVCVVLVWSPSFMLPSALRAASDVKFCMVVAVGSMWIFRIALSYVLVQMVGLGILGVWVAMTTDWLVRAILFTLRYRGDKWQTNYLAKGVEL